MQDLLLGRPDQLIQEVAQEPGLVGVAGMTAK